MWLWQLPQHLVALIILSINCFNFYVKIVEKRKVYFVKHCVFRSGVSLGDYVILHRKYDSKDYYVTSELVTVIKHKFGHSVQSKIFGPTYLLLVGIPSIFRALYGDLQENMNFLERRKWYYSGYPEDWADKISNIKRIF